MLKKVITFVPVLLEMWQPPNKEFYTNLRIVGAATHAEILRFPCFIPSL